MARAAAGLQVVITSYNRARFLDHCVRSVEQCMPYARILIRDDGSDDAATLAVLDELTQRHKVVRGDGAGAGKHGGLYGHMQAALDVAEPDTLLLFLQDDVQIVRAVSVAEIQALYALYDSEPTLGFVSPCFIPVSGKGRSADHGFDYTASTQMFWPRPSGQSAGVYYSDICICLPRRLHAVHWRFGRREPECEALARQHFRNMAIPQVPFVAWLPLVPAYRGKRKTWALARAERLRNAGFHPFRMLDTAQVEGLRAQNPPQPPWTEDVLSLRDSELPKPWHHNPMQGRRWLKRINNAETALRRWFGS